MKTDIKPNFKLERELWKKGYQVVIGVDEVGRGAIAGPVVAGAVYLGSESFLPCSPAAAGRLRAEKRLLAQQNWIEVGIDDSKKLTAKKRERLARIIKKNATWGIGEVGVATINRIGIVKATERAMRSAIANCKLKIANGKFQNKNFFVLVDAFHVKYVPGVGLANQRAIVKGDQKVLTIAAASIIAKVYRDKIMARLGRQNKYNRYHWEKNKGYGTREHWEAVKRAGLTKLHRLAFVKKFI